MRFRTLRVPLPELDPALEGLRIVHLSDFHLGFPSRATRAVERAVEWAASREPDLVLVSGDLLAHPRGEARLRALASRLPRCFAVLGNHDFAEGRDPFSRPAPIEELSPATLLFDRAETIVVRRRTVQIAGVDPRSYQLGRAHPERLADPDADLRVLVCHFPGVLDRLPPGAFHLVLAGHMHAGQIVLPYPGGKIRFAHLRSRLTEGLYSEGGVTLHVSPGLGTTFVPFRFFARPEVTELVLRRSD